MKQILLVVILGLLMEAVSGSVLTGVAQQSQPPLDISGIKEIQSIPVGKSRVYIQGDDRAGKFSMEKILDSIANLAVMQFDVEKFTMTIKDPKTGKEETIIGGEFGRIIRKEILGFDPETEIILGVKHIELVQTPGLTPKFDEDKFKLYFGGRDIDLVLARDLGKPEKGFEWGVGLLSLSRYVDGKGVPPPTEQLVLTLDYHKAIYIKRILAPNGTLLSGEKWEFVPGNPNPVSYSKFP